MLWCFHSLARVFVDKTELYFAATEEFFCLIEYFGVENNVRARQHSKGCFYRQQIVVEGGAHVARREAHDGHQHAVYGFHVFVGQPQRTQHFHACHLKILSVVAIINVAHRVCFDVSDAQLGGMDIHFCSVSLVKTSVFLLANRRGFALL